MNSAELFIRCLESEGVRHVFGLPGEENIDLLHAMNASRISFILTHDERAAAFMANAYGRLSDLPGVCLSTLGPGATNLLTGVADSLLDFSPMVAVTGQAGLSVMHKESHQYVDILSTFKPLTKWNARIERPEIIPEITRKAFKTAAREKPGPAHIVFPEDIAASSAEGSPLRHESPTYPEPSEKILAEAVSMIENSRMPFVLAGHGIVRGKATRELEAFVSGVRIGTMTTFMGTGALPADSPFFISTVGLQSKDYVLCSLDRADLVIAIGYDPVEFSPAYWNPDGSKKIIHINFTPSETDSHYDALELIGDIGATLSQIKERIQSKKDDSYSRSLKQYADHALEFSLKGYPLTPYRIISDMRKSLGRDDILVSDVGAHKIWIGRFFPSYAPNTVLISNGYASMGFAIPTAITAKLLHPGKKVLAAIGDGGFLMSMSEINTAVRLGLGIVFLIFNDGGLGLIKWKEQLRYHDEFFVNFKNPDFVKLADAFGAKGIRISSEHELLPALRHAFSESVPTVIDCPVDYSENLRLTGKLGGIICPT